MLSEKITRARWTPEEDELLVDVISRHVEAGESLTAAFAAAAEQLQGRTAAACGFRWNTELKNHHRLSVQPKRGRRQRQERPAAADKPVRAIEAAAAAKSDALPSALLQMLDAAPKVHMLFVNLTQELKGLRDKLRQAEKENKSLRQQLAAYEQLSDATAQSELEIGRASCRERV